MTDSNNIGVPYNTLSKIRYSEHLDHTALIKRLNDIADDIYRLTGLCNDIETRLSDHNDATDAHRALRESINNVNSRIAGLMTSVDASIAEVNTSLETTQTTLTAANNQLSNKVTQLETELADIRAEVENVILSTSTTIVSSVDGAPIIESSADAGNLTLAKIPSTHGSFTYGVHDGKNTVEYTASSNTTGVPTYAATLLDESGNATFPKAVTATSFNGNASSATTSANASKLDHNVTFTLKDATNETASSVTTDLTGNVTLKLPSILRGTDITGGASYATSDSMGANIANTYMHKTNVDETIAGTKTFSGTLRSDTVIPKTHAGSTLGSTSAPYEEIHGTNITGETANIPSITGSLTGNASTATKLVTARQINGTEFDGTTAITTNKWGTARSMNITDASGTNVGGVVNVDGSDNVTLKLPSTIKASISGNVSSATKLNTARQINGTAFDGTRNITTAKWGTGRNIVIWDGPGIYHGDAQNVDGSSDIQLRLPLSIVANNFCGVANQARELYTTVAINGTRFNGTTDITTTKWGTSRDIVITDASGTNYGIYTPVDGSDSVTLKLPSTIKATLSGNASSATQFSANKSVTLTGDVTGTASSKGGWSIATTLANSGVTAGNYGPTANVTGNNNTTISVPQIKVNSKGLVTSITNRTYTSVDTHYTTMMYAGARTTQDNDTSANGYTYLKLYDNNTARSRIKLMGTGSVSVTADAGIITINSDVIPLASKQVAGIVKVGDDIDVDSNGVISVADTVLKSNKTQNFDNEALLKLMSNLGIINVNSVGSWLQHSINFSDLVIQYGNSLLAESIPGDSNRKICTVCYREPVTSVSNFAIGSPLSSYPDGDQCCSVLVDNYGPRTMLMGLGDVDQSSRVRYLAVNYRFPIDENKYDDTTETAYTSSSYPSNYKDGICFTENWSGSIFYTLSKSSAGYTAFNHVNPVFLVDMFMSANAPSSDYIEFSLESSTIGSSDSISTFGKTRLSNTVNIRQDGGRKYFSRGYDINLASSASGDNNSSLTILGYKDRSNGRLLRDSLFNTFIMSSFTITINDTTNFFNGTSYFRLAFNKSFSSGVKGYIRIFYLGTVGGVSAPTIDV